MVEKMGCNNMLLDTDVFTKSDEGSVEMPPNSVLVDLAQKFSLT